MNKFLYSLCLFAFLKGGYACAQGGSYSFLTFFYIDNSTTLDSEPMNDDLVDELSNTVNRVSTKVNNCFYLYGCNGENSVVYTNALSSSDQLKKYLVRPSRESEYAFDKSNIRAYFEQNPVEIRQSLEVYVFLSVSACNRMINATSELPTPKLLATELPAYIKHPDNQPYSLKVVICIDKDVIEKLGTGFTPEEKSRNGEARLREYFQFGNESIAPESIKYDIKFL